MLPQLQEHETCGRQECFLHQNGGKGDCNREGVVYMGQCEVCRNQGIVSKYIGETSRSLFVRGKQHKAAIRQNNVNNAFRKHINEYHPNETRGNDIFRMKVLKSYQRPLERQIAEGVIIHNLHVDADITMNSKLDHYQPAITRVTFTNELL